MEYNIETVNSYLVDDGFVEEASSAVYSLDRDDVLSGVESVRGPVDVEILESVRYEDKSLEELWNEGIRNIGDNLDRLDNGHMVERKVYPVEVTSTRLSKLYLNSAATLEAEKIE